MCPVDCISKAFICMQYILCIQFATACLRQIKLTCYMTVALTFASVCPRARARRNARRRIFWGRRSSTSSSQLFYFLLLLPPLSLASSSPSPLLLLLMPSFFVNPSRAILSVRIGKIVAWCKPLLLTIGIRVLNDTCLLSTIDVQLRIECLSGLHGF